MAKEERDEVVRDKSTEEVGQRKNPWPRLRLANRTLNEAKDASRNFGGETIGKVPNEGGANGTIARGQFEKILN
jgi:hypothetical protein